MRVLFVDDEINVLNGLRRAMHSMRGEWDMRFASGAEEALSLLAAAPADVVVSDMRMPGFDGAALLAQIKRRHPDTIRFILSGHAEPAAVLKAATTAHQYLAKPCDVTVLKAAIARAQALKARLSDSRIASWVGQAEALPNLPDAYRRITQYLHSPEASIAGVAQIIETDPSATTMLLKVANSAFFGSAQQVRSTVRAVSFLGIANVAALVLADSVFAQTQHTSVNVAQLWQHSLVVGATARTLALAEGWSNERSDDVFLAGMLHDIGWMVLPADEQIDAIHAQAGAYLLGLWGFPDFILEAVAFHHIPSQLAATAISLPAFIHVAQLLATTNDVPADPCSLPGADTQFFAQPMVRERWPAWKTMRS